MTTDTFTDIDTAYRGAPEDGLGHHRMDLVVSPSSMSASRRQADSAPDGGVAPGLSKGWTTETVLSVNAWTPTLFSLRTSRHPGFDFAPGQYARIGLTRADGTIDWRPYSIASGAADRHFEFVGAILPDSMFTRRLARLHPGAQILVDKLSYGGLTLDRFVDGSDLWMLSSGTGIAPFLSILSDPGAWERFEHLIIVHSVRQANALVYRDEIVTLAQGDPPSGGRAQLRYVPVVTRECCPDALRARITRLIDDGRLEGRAGVPLDRERSRIMVCGNMEMTDDLRQWFAGRGFRTGRHGNPGNLAFESY